MRHEDAAGNAIGLAIAFVLILAIPHVSYWPLLVLLLDGPVLAARRLRRR